MRFSNPNTERTPFNRFEYPFAYPNQGATTQNGSATSILAPDIRHSKNDKILMKMMKKGVIPNRSRITLGMFLWLQDIKKHV